MAQEQMKNLAFDSLTKSNKNTNCIASFIKLSQYMIAEAICCIGLAGCSYISSNPIDQLPDKSGTILSERLDSAATRNMLGNPLIASRCWGVEIFRDANWQIEVPLAIVVPCGWVKDDIYRYTLVSYDNKQPAQHKASGIHRRPAQWRRASPIEYQNLTLDIQAGDFTFIVEWNDRYETLLVNPARRDAYLEQSRLSSHGTVVIGCGTTGCSNKLRIDDGPTLPLPCRLSVQNFDPNALTLLRQGKQEEYEKAYPIKTYNAIAALSLAPGAHTLKAWGRIKGEQSLAFSCRAGEILYVIIDVSAREYSSWWGAEGIEWKIDLKNEMPSFFTDRPLILYRGGQWLVNPEPMN